MPSTLHDGLAHMLRDHPEFVVQLLRGLARAHVPEHDTVRKHEGDLGTPKAVELRVDGAFVIDHGVVHVLGVVLEVQFAIKPAKLFSWPSYVAGLRARLGCDVVLVVVTNDRDVAAWARRPISLGPGTGFVQALVLGPDELPAITDPDAARRDLELAVLGAVAHGHDQAIDRAVAAAQVALGAAAEVGGESAILYYDLITAALSQAARKALTMLPEGYQFIDEGFRRAHAEGEAKGEARGEAKGKAEGVLAVLEARGLAVSAEQRARILGCNDVSQLDQWLRAAVTAASTDSLIVH